MSTNQTNGLRLIDSKIKSGQIILYFVPLFLFVAIWSIATELNSQNQFIFASPRLVTASFLKLILNGELLHNSYVTVCEALAGFILGTVSGAIIGLSLWCSKLLAQIAKPYITALSTIPIFALAPIFIVWFGIGIWSKIMLAFISTICVAIVQSYQGAMAADDRFLRFMQVVGASRLKIFKLVIVPSSLIWVMNAAKLNIGLALLGAFIGEFISSEEGLGYMIVKASGLYDMATVIAGIITLIVIALILTSIVEQIEKIVLEWKYLD
jgi:NitT/TauT family transport system permease protein